ncbi:MAG: endonuclease/exonuclease/phosphatase family protein [Pedobacter sp.]|nr:endonuclease/exonuclease/phosphatase family protein [Pedobacter sp.]
MKKAQRTSFLDHFMRIIGVIFSIALILACIAGKIDPRDSKYIPFFGLAYPYLLMINAAMIVWWLFTKKWYMACSSLLVILIGWQAFNASFGFFGNKGIGPKTDTDAIRMMTYNVHSFKPYGEEVIETVKEQMLDLIEGEHPDIICFQEFFTRYKGPYNITDSLKQSLKIRNIFFVPISQNEYEANGLAIFSRYPIINKGQIDFREHKNGNTCIWVDIQTPTKIIRVYNVHLQSIAFDKQDYNYLDKIKNKMDPELSSSKRILSMLKLAFRKRSEQVDYMQASMRNCRIPYILAGDFNDTPASYAVTKLTSYLNNSFVKEGTGFGRTYNGKFPNFQIDYISTTQNIDILNHNVIEAKLSDHFPVRSDLKLKP